MANNIFDSHAHYLDARFDDDRESVLTGLKDAGVAYVTEIGCNMPNSYDCVSLSERYDFVYAAVGVHPHDAQNANAGYLDELKALLEKPKVVALGEIGLDYHYDFSPRDVQLRVFEEQLKLAKELDRPVVIHDREAHEPTLRLLTQYRPKGIVHCFSGSAEMAKQLVQLGFYIGFTGVVTFKNARKTLEAAAAVPMDRLLLETDCPYMAPEPFRGKRCDSSMIEKTAQALSNVKGIPMQELIDQCNENTRRVYELK